MPDPSANHGDVGVAIDVVDEIGDDLRRIADIGEVHALQGRHDDLPDRVFLGRSRHVGIGDDAIDGVIFKGSYGVLDGVHNVIPVDFRIPGDPPSPKTIICHLLQILEALDSQTRNENA